MEQSECLRISDDPWLPVVYIGIFMLLIGAVGMFLTASRKKEVEP